MVKKALVVIDVQNDFCSGGALAVPGSLDIIPVINKMRDKFDLVIFSKDWHPEDHSSFKINGGIWPVHCVQKSIGAKRHQGLIKKSSDYIVLKGTEKQYDSYSAFYKAKDIDLQTDLDKILKFNKIDEVYYCGLATEYCVFSTVFDSYKFRHKSFLISDAIAGLDKDKCNESISKLKDLGVEIITSTNI